MQALKVRPLLILTVSLLLTGCVSWLAPKVESEVVKLRPGQYTLDKTHTTVLFKIQHLELSTYVGRFNMFDASLDFDPLNPESMNLEASIDINSLDINNPSLKNDLMGRTWFHQKKYPQAKFTTLKVEPLGDNQFTSSLSRWCK